MKQIKKKRILKIAEEAGLVYNTTEPYNFEILPQHADALYEFYLLIEQEQEKYAQEENAKDSGVLHHPEPEST